MDPPLELLLTGATGYIGGTILAHLLESSSPFLTNATITCLLRGQERASTLRSAYGERIRPVIYEGIDDIDATIEIAAQHDIVINTNQWLPYPFCRGIGPRACATKEIHWA